MMGNSATSSRIEEGVATRNAITVRTMSASLTWSVNASDTAGSRATNVAATAA